MLPKFLIAGIMKSGTTYLDNLVRRHSQIQMPERSMGYSFFDNDSIYKKGINWYRSIFDGFDDKLQIGQTSADCAFNLGSIERIKKHLPNTKLIFIFRNPIDRAYSLYWHQVKMGREYKNFEKAIELEERRIAKSYYNYKMYSYLERSRYAKQVKQIMQYFNEDQVLFIPFEVLIKNELKILNVVFDFLKVDQIENLLQLNINSVPKNKATIPKYKSILWFTSLLHKMNLTRLGRLILSKTLKEERPPKMSIKTRLKLEKLLSEDVNFHNDLIEKYLLNK